MNLVCCILRTIKTVGPEGMRTWTPGISSKRRITTTRPRFQFENFPFHACLLDPICYMRRMSVSVCVCFCISIDPCPIIDLHCQQTDQAQTQWRDRVYPHLNPPKKSQRQLSDFAIKVIFLSNDRTLLVLLVNRSSSNLVQRQGIPTSQSSENFTLIAFTILLQRKVGETRHSSLTHLISLSSISTERDSKELSPLAHEWALIRPPSSHQKIVCC